MSADRHQELSGQKRCRDSFTELQLHISMKGLVSITRPPASQAPDDSKTANCMQGDPEQLPALQFPLEGPLNILAGQEARRGISLWFPVIRSAL